MGGKQTKNAGLIKGTETLSTPPFPTTSTNLFGDVEPKKQLHQLLTTSFNNYAAINYCDDNQLWYKVIEICNIHPMAAAYTDPVSFETPLHLACRILERFPPLVTKNEITTSPADAILILIRCCSESVSQKDIDGYIPLHYIIPHSRRSIVSHQQQAQQQNSQLNHIQNQVIVLNLLIGTDHDSSIKYLSRSDVKFSPTDRACTPLYYAVSSVHDDFLQHTCPTVDLISTIHSACPRMVSVKNGNNRDTPLAQLYRRFSRQLASSEKVFKGRNSRKKELEHQLRYKTSAMNTWKIILKLLLMDHTAEGIGNEQPKKQQNVKDFCILHTAVTLDCPLDLIRYIIKTRASEVSKTDELGRLPLHIAAATTPLDFNSEDRTEGGHYHSKVVIEELLHVYPDGAACADRDGKLPLQLAIKSGKFWHGSGVKSIYDVFPEAMANITVQEYPVIEEKDDGSISMASWQNCINN